MSAFLLACPYCVSDTSGRNSDAATWTLLVMLGVLAFMFSGLGFVAYTFYKRAKLAQAGSESASSPSL